MALPQGELKCDKLAPCRIAICLGLLKKNTDLSKKLQNLFISPPSLHWPLTGLKWEAYTHRVLLWEYTKIPGAHL